MHAKEDRLVSSLRSTKTNALVTYLNVKNNLGQERSERDKKLHVSHEPLDGLLEQLLLEANRVVTYLRLGHLPIDRSITIIITIIITKASTHVLLCTAILTDLRW